VPMCRSSNLVGNVVFLRAFQHSKQSMSLLISSFTGRLIDCIYCFTSRLRIFHSHRDVIIVGEGLQHLGVCSDDARYVTMRRYVKIVTYCSANGDAM
jgi:hypothetical protein